jgi:hypothetical protein
MNTEIVIKFENTNKEKIIKHISHFKPIVEDGSATFQITESNRHIFFAVESTISLLKDNLEGYYLNGVKMKRYPRKRIISKTWQHLVSKELGGTYVAVVAVNNNTDNEAPCALDDESSLDGTSAIRLSNRLIVALDVVISVKKIRGEPQETRRGLLEKIIKLEYEKELNKGNTSDIFMNLLN